VPNTSTAKVKITAGALRETNPATVLAAPVNLPSNLGHGGEGDHTPRGGFGLVGEDHATPHWHRTRPLPLPAQLRLMWRRCPLQFVWYCTDGWLGEACSNHMGVYRVNRRPMRASRYGDATGTLPPIGAAGLAGNCVTGNTSSGHPSPGTPISSPAPAPEPVPAPVPVSSTPHYRGCILTPHSKTRPNPGVMVGIRLPLDCHRGEHTRRPGMRPAPNHWPRRRRVPHKPTQPDPA